MNGQIDPEAMEHAVSVVQSIGVEVHERSRVRSESTLEQLKALGYVE